MEVSEHREALLYPTVLEISPFSVKLLDISVSGSNLASMWTEYGYR